jgi:class 3 adenylate cyclase
VHIGEVQGIAGDVRGIAVHEVARITDAAAPNEILVSSVTRALAGSSGLQFEDRGPHLLKGLPEELVLYAYVE